MKLNRIKNKKKRIFIFNVFFNLLRRKDDFMNIERIWAMPNKNTFDIKPIKTHSRRIK